MIERAEKRAEKLLSTLEELEKRLKIAEKLPEAKKIIGELREQIPRLRELACGVVTTGKELATRIVPGLKEALPKLPAIIKALEDRETTLRLKFNKLNIILDGEKEFSITLLKSKK